MIEAEQVWVFNGAKSNFPSGIFRSLDQAERWIAHHRLTGTLTLYPVDTGVYDWAISKGFFRPSKPHQATPDFIGHFTSASMGHHHYEDGRRQT
jgi:hypothetical protein